MGAIQTTFFIISAIVIFYEFIKMMSDARTYFRTHRTTLNNKYSKLKDYLRENSEMKRGQVLILLLV